MMENNECARKTEKSVRKRQEIYEAKKQRRITKSKNK